MMKSWLFIPLLYVGLFISCSDTSSTKQKQPEIQIQAKDTISTALNRLTLFDQKHLADVNQNWELVSGRQCNECGQNPAIYLINSNKDTPISELENYSYPGKLWDWETGELLFESQLFVGECLSKNEKEVIWLQEGYSQSPKPDFEIFSIRFEADSLIRNRPDFDRKILLNIHEQIKLGKCREIPPIDQTSEP